MVWRPVAAGSRGSVPETWTTHRTRLTARSLVPSLGPWEAPRLSPPHPELASAPICSGGPEEETPHVNKLHPAPACRPATTSHAVPAPCWAPAQAGLLSVETWLHPLQGRAAGLGFSHSFHSCQGIWNLSSTQSSESAPYLGWPAGPHNVPTWGRPRHRLTGREAQSAGPPNIRGA